MAQRIFKFQIHSDRVGKDGRFGLQMPIGAQILTAQMQLGVPQLWAVVDHEEKTLATYEMLIVGTGQDIKHNGVYVATFQDGIYVWHLFHLQAKGN